MDSDRSSNAKQGFSRQPSGARPGSRATTEGTLGAACSPLDLARLFRTERSALYRTARRHLRDAEDADDLVQDAFARLAQARPPALLRAPAAYLQRIMRNLLRDRHKRAEARMTFCEVTLCDAEAIAIPPDQGWAIEVEDLAALYAEAVAALPAKTRAVFLLHRVDGLRYRDIGARLGISVATVEYHMARALTHLDLALNP